MRLNKKQEKVDFINGHPEIRWNEMKQNKDSTYGAAAVSTYIGLLKLNHEFDMSTEEGKIVTIIKKMEQKTIVNREIKELSEELENKAINKLANLSDREVDDLLAEKWIDPVMFNIDEDVKQVMMRLVKALEALKEKYRNPLPELDEQIVNLNSSLNGMFEQLCGSPSDMEAIDIFRRGLQ